MLLMEWLIVLGVIVLLLVILVVTFIAMYNTLQRFVVRVDEAWSDITVQLKRRADLLPNLIESVRGYASHEKGVFEEVTQARAQTLQAAGEGPAQGPADAGAAEGFMQRALGRLFAVAENYPDLKANQNFLQLQNELVDTEDKIAASRRFYNGGVRELNSKVKTFPSNLIAGMFNIQERQFFEVADRAAISEPPRVQF